MFSSLKFFVIDYIYQPITIYLDNKYIDFMSDFVDDYIDNI